MLNPSQGGSDPRIPETIGKLQILQQFAIPSAKKRKPDLSNEDKPIYIGMETQACKIDDNEKRKKKKEGNGNDVEEEKGIKDRKKESVPIGMNQLNKSIRKLEDGLLMVVAARIYGKQVRAFIDNGATRCFVTPACVAAVGLNGTP